MEDSKIVDLFLQREESAISYTTAKYGQRLRAISYRIVGDSHTSQECENDTYFQAWNLIPPNEPRTYLYAFLSKIIRNISINRCIELNALKRKAFITELTNEMEQCLPSTNSVEDHINVTELGKAISDFLRQQKPVRRNVFIHRYYYLDSISSIAKRFSFSESKIKVMLYRMRNDLRDYLVKEDFDI